jgi:O-antigen ligase
MNYLRRYLNHPVLRQLAFYALLASGAYVVLLWSPNVLGKHVTTLVEFIIFTLPWLMLWVIYTWQTISDRHHRVEIVLMVAIIFFGMINTALSDSFAKSLPQMRPFLLSGVMALWASMFLITDADRRRAFDWFCCVCLAIIIPVEFILWVARGPYGDKVFQIFDLHPIPLGTVVLLLSPGPARLLLSPGLRSKVMGSLLALLAAALIFLTHKRGTWLAVTAMAAVGLAFSWRRQKFLILSLFMGLALVVTVKTVQMISRLDSNVPRYASVLQRLELYHFALHIWKTHPLMGTGLRPFTQARYLPGYQQHNQTLADFPQAVAKLQTLDNMLLTAGVELGSLMTVSYLGLVLFIVIRYVRILWSSPASSPLDWYRLLVLFGFACHSMTYDSLLFPPVNWLFHAQLGIVAAFLAPVREPGAALAFTPAS